MAVAIDKLLQRHPIDPSRNTYSSRRHETDFPPTETEIDRLTQDEASNIYNNNDDEEAAANQKDAASSSSSSSSSSSTSTTTMTRRRRCDFVAPRREARNFLIGFGSIIQTESRQSAYASSS